MKKRLLAVGLGAVLGLSLMACGTSTSNSSSETEYTIGIAQTQGLKEYLQGRLGVDTAYMSEFIKGLTDGAYAGDDKKQTAYYAGIQIGQQIGNQMIKGINQEVFGNDSTKSISLDNFLAGFIHGVSGTNKIPIEQAQAMAQTKMDKVKAETLEKEYGPNKKAGEEFIANKAKEEGVQTLENGILYKVITEGKGETPKATDKVKVHYKGTLIDGTEFDSSYKRSEPTTFRANQVIHGWTTALTHMPVGSKWEVYIPQEEGYGSREAGTIKPFSALVFEIELLDIEKED